MSGLGRRAAANCITGYRAACSHCAQLIYSGSTLQSPLWVSLSSRASPGLQHPPGRPCYTLNHRPTAAGHRQGQVVAVPRARSRHSREQAVPKEPPSLSTPPNGNSPVWPCCVPVVCQGWPGSASTPGHSELCLSRCDSFILHPWGQTAAPQGNQPCQQPAWQTPCTTR